MENNTTFKITYYAGKHKKHITRLGKWVEGCRYWTDKSGKAIFTYFDLNERRSLLNLGSSPGLTVASSQKVHQSCNLSIKLV